MKPKLNYAELEQKIDFAALAGRLGQLSERDNPQRKTVVTLLNKVRDALLEARRSRKVSCHVLAKELTAAGLVVSEPTLRKYLRAQGAEKNARKKANSSAGSAQNKPQPPAQSHTVPASTATPIAEPKPPAATGHPNFNFGARR